MLTIRRGSSRNGNITYRTVTDSVNDHVSFKVHVSKFCRAGAVPLALCSRLYEQPYLILHKNVYWNRTMP